MHAWEGGGREGGGQRSRSERQKSVLLYPDGGAHESCVVAAIAHGTVRFTFSRGQLMLSLYIMVRSRTPPSLALMSKMT